MPFDVAVITDPRLRRLHDYWRAKAGDRRMPARKDIDPIDMKEWLGNLVLVEFFEGGTKSRVRLEGTNITEFYGATRLGSGLETLKGEEERKLLLTQYGAVIADCEPAFYSARFTTSENKYVHQVKLLLPLSDDDRRVNMILGGIYFRRHDENAE